MSGAGHISYIPSHAVDTEKWDRCIAGSPNGMIYSFSFYLHHMADQWDALVLNDYEAVMPLCYRKKWSFYYLYQPFLTAQLGITGRSVDQEIVKQFLSAIPGKFRLWEFSLNHGNVFSIQSYHIYERKNFVLDLGPSYETLYQNFKETTRRNIKKAYQYGCRLNERISIDDVIEMAGGNERPGSMKDFDQFRQLYLFLKQKGQARIYGISSDQDQLLACSVFLFSHQRAYYILVGNHPNGRTLGASHALIDAFIKDHAGQHLLLDFEGSDISSLAFFYSSFGAVEEKYAAIRKNDLPWYVRWMK